MKNRTTMGQGAGRTRQGARRVGIALTVSAMLSASMILAGCTPSVDPTAGLTDPFTSGQSGARYNDRSSSQMSGDVAERSQSTRSLLDSWPQGAPGPDEGPAITRGTGSVRVGVVSDSRSELPARVLEEFTRRSGFTAEVTPISRFGSASGLSSLASEGEADVLMGLDAADVADLGLKDATRYGRDDVCVGVDRLFIEANRTEAATSFDQLTDAGNAAQLSVPDPASSAAGRAFMVATAGTYSDRAEQWWKEAAQRGVKVAKEDGGQVTWSATVHRAAEEAQSGSGGALPDALSYYSAVTSTDVARPPLLVNTASESYARIIGGTCVKRLIFAAVRPGAEATPAAAAWIAFLQGAMAQRIMALDGVTWPAAWSPEQSAALATDSVLSWVAAPADQAVEVPNEQWARYSSTLLKWQEAFGR